MCLCACLALRPARETEWLCEALQDLTPPPDPSPLDPSPFQMPSSSFWEGPPHLLAATEASSCILQAVPLCYLRSEAGCNLECRNGHFGHSNHATNCLTGTVMLCFTLVLCLNFVCRSRDWAVCCALLSVCFP